MRRQQNLAHFNMYTNDLYVMIKYFHEHRDVLHFPVEEMMQLAENLERHVNCSKQLNDEVENCSLLGQPYRTFDEIKQFHNKRMSELMTIASLKPIERYEAMRRERLLTVNEVISKVDPFTKEKIRHPLRNVLCGHVYDAEGVKKMLEQSEEAGATACPCAVEGCANPNIKMDDMKLYLEFFAKAYL